ncbi:MAG: hypothetical protein NVS3B26_30410 [Mycobacteriales bacterium]
MVRRGRLTTLADGGGELRRGGGAGLRADGKDGLRVDGGVGTATLMLGTVVQRSRRPNAVAPGPFVNR